MARKRGVSGVVTESVGSKAEWTPDRVRALAFLCNDRVVFGSRMRLAEVAGIHHATVPSEDNPCTAFAARRLNRVLDTMRLSFADLDAIDPPAAGNPDDWTPERVRSLAIICNNGREHGASVALAGKSGLSKHYIRAILSGRREIGKYTAGMLDRVASTLGLTPEEIAQRSPTCRPVVVEWSPDLAMALAVALNGGSVPGSMASLARAGNIDLSGLRGYLRGETGLGQSCREALDRVLARSSLTVDELKRRAAMKVAPETWTPERIKALAITCNGGAVKGSNNALSQATGIVHPRISTLVTGKVRCGPVSSKRMNEVAASLGVTIADLDAFLAGERPGVKADWTLDRVRALAYLRNGRVVVDGLARLAEAAGVHPNRIPTEARPCTDFVAERLNKVLVSLGLSFADLDAVDLPTSGNPGDWLPERVRGLAIIHNDGRERGSIMALAKETGLDPTSIRAILSGKNKPSRLTAGRFDQAASALGLTLEEIDRQVAECRTATAVLTPERVRTEAATCI